MKKIISFLLILGILFCAVACADSTDSTAKDNTDKVQKDTQSSDDHSETTKDNNGGIHTEVTLSAVLSAKTSPEEDFEIVDYGTGEVELYNYLGDDEIVVIPESIDGMVITKISSYVFANDRHPNTKAVRLSDGIKTVDYCAFSLNESIEIVVAGEGLETIAESAFMSCTNLSTVVLNDRLTTMENNCFAYCDSLKEIELPSSAAQISEYAFFGIEGSLTIVGEAGSAVETYANDLQIGFKAK